MTTTPRRRGGLTRTEEAPLAWAQFKARRRGRRGQLQPALLPAGASPTTQAVLDFFREFKGSPTFREIQDACRLSTPSLAHYHVSLLVNRFGKLERRGHRYVLREEAL